MAEEIKKGHVGKAVRNNPGFIRRHKIMLAMLAAGAAITAVNPYVGVPVMVGAAAFGMARGFMTFVSSRASVSLSAVSIKKDAKTFAGLIFIMCYALSSSQFSRNFPVDTSALTAARTVAQKELLDNVNTKTPEESILLSDRKSYIVEVSRIRQATNETTYDLGAGKKSEKVAWVAQLNGEYTEKGTRFLTLRPYEEKKEIREEISLPSRSAIKTAKENPAAAPHNN